MKIRDRMARWLGYEVINRRKDHKLYEGHLIGLLDRYQIDCVIDVGANKGQYGLLLRALGYKGRILSFEPVKETFDLLSDVVRRDPFWEAHHCALGSEEGNKVIRVSKNTDLSSFLESNETLACMFSGNDGGRIEKEESVVIRRLDTVLPALMKDKGVIRRLALKLDTQGYDLEVFKGAPQTISQVAVLQTEVANTPLYKDCPGFLTALSTYLKAGFELTGLFPESRNIQDLRAIEFNCLMVQKNLCPGN